MQFFHHNHSALLILYGGKYTHIDSSFVDAESNLGLLSSDQQQGELVKKQVVSDAEQCGIECRACALLIGLILVLQASHGVGGWIGEIVWIALRYPFSHQ